MVAAGDKVKATDITSITPTAADWTPTITNLTKGSGSSEEWWYSQTGDWVDAQGTIVLGTSPSFAGSLTWSLPVAAYSGASTNDQSIGDWVYRDGSSGWYAGTVETYDSSGTDGRCAGSWSGSAPSEFVGQGGSSPVSPASGDKISLSLRYRAAT